MPSQTNPQQPEIKPPVPDVQPQRGVPEIPPDKDAPEKNSPAKGKN